MVSSGTERAGRRVFLGLAGWIALSGAIAFAGTEFGKAGEEILARNVDLQTVTALRDRLDRINGAYKDVKPGDRYALTYRPGKGTELSFNGKPLVLVEGDDFAAAYFSIWLGKKPIDEDLKNELLRRG